MIKNRTWNRMYRSLFSNKGALSPDRMRRLYYQALKKRDDPGKYVGQGWIARRGRCDVVTELLWRSTCPDDVLLHAATWKAAGHFREDIAMQYGLPDAVIEVLRCDPCHHVRQALYRNTSMTLAFLLEQREREKSIGMLEILDDQIARHGLVALLGEI